MHGNQGSSIGTSQKSRLSKAQPKFAACAQQRPDQDPVKSQDMWLPSAVSTAQTFLCSQFKDLSASGQTVCWAGCAPSHCGVCRGNRLSSATQQDTNCVFCRRVRGFGFVEFIDDRDAEDAERHFDGTVIGGRTITVSFIKACDVQNRCSILPMCVEAHVLPAILDPGDQALLCAGRVTGM